MSRYCRISADEMREMLKMEKGWIESVDGKELVFKFPLKSRADIQVKVFSSIKFETKIGRDVGKDAIRICATRKLSNLTEIGWIKSARVYRTTNWRNNLKQRVFEVIEKSKLRR